MSSSRRPARRLLRRAAACAPLLLAPVLLPAVASADYTSANQWGGGVLAADRMPGNARYPVKGTLVSMTTSPTKARLSLAFRTRPCNATTTLTGRVTVVPGGDEEHLALTVDGSRKIRNSKKHLDYAVALRPAAPGVLTGVASMRGTIRDGKRVYRCNATSTVTVRSRSVLAAPLQPSPTDASLPRVGVLSSTVAPRVKAAIAITKRADGGYHAIWSEHVSCASGSKRSSFDSVNFAPRFRIRADGTFRARETVHERAKTKKGRSTYTFVGRISGRIDADGVARGAVSTSSRYRETGYRDLVCRGSASFMAAP